MKDNEENNGETRKNLEVVEETLDAVWRDLESKENALHRHTSELAAIRKAVSSSDLEDFKRTLIEQLMANEEKVEMKTRSLEEALDRLDAALSQWGNETAILGGNLIELEARLENDDDDKRRLFNKAGLHSFRVFQFACRLFESKMMLHFVISSSELALLIVVYLLQTLATFEMRIQGNEKSVQRLASELNEVRTFFSKSLSP